MLDREKLLAITDNVVFDEDMKKHTSFRIGGTADAFVSVTSALEIEKIICFCADTETPYMIMGNGSNILVSDKGIRGVVIHIGNGMSKCRIEGCDVYADAGILMSALSKKLLEANLTGFEFASGIPGTLGGGIFMNAGAYGGELKDIIESVTFICPDGIIKTETAENLGFAYRRSMFTEGGYVILSCKLRLREGNYEDIKAMMSDFNSRRTDS